MDAQSIKEAFSKVFYGETEKLMKESKLPYCKEISPGLWEIFDGTNTLHTGDGGKKMFDEALKNVSNAS
jgi:hypothetical protein